MNGSICLDEDLDTDGNDRDAPEIMFADGEDGNGKRSSRKPL